MTGVIEERLFAVADVGEVEGIAAAAEEVVRHALASVQALLVEQRAAKEVLAAHIRQLVEEETTLKQAVRVFDRRPSEEVSDAEESR